jgi:ribosomal protein S9
MTGVEFCDSGEVKLQNTSFYARIYVMTIAQEEMPQTPASQWALNYARVIADSWNECRSIISDRYVGRHREVIPVRSGIARALGRFATSALAYIREADALVVDSVGVEDYTIYLRNEEIEAAKQKSPTVEQLCDHASS